ncbi:uncharacterized protein K452DRAFT_290548 [Aplosporella prunicola CBS 121167]|uniref:Uncharacterized protein n=1 Tax=Aplosporella prunicola CBS 121167 TaxID=1176127 RepID=A0A6A6B3W1_9PEZI|nr:uncharacterized protein K452DRAFT_290548 [Aplosporella prunicola CBS 121167]KAF2138902.1 hypothetical protein K452DRAFT_290548 [Aplosporella prunicola CBS 121167]
MAAGATPNTTTPAAGPPPTQKVSDVVATFRPTRCFRAESSKTHVTSIDFDDSGELAIVARDDDTLQIYNCKEGKHAKELKSQKYGVHLARFTHHAQSIVYASTKVDDGIRYLSTHDNSYIRYFKGHTDTVTCLAVNPSNDTFISCSADNTVRLWALNSPNVQGLLKLHAPYLAAYDPSASVIAIASPPTQSILLYDVRNFDKPPFATFDLHDVEQRYTPGAAGRNWAKLEFSNDGRSLLLGTTGFGHYILDAFDGTLRHFCVRDSGPTGRRAAGEYPAPGTVASQGDMCLSPDGQYLIGGSGNNGLLVWDIQTKEGGDKTLKPMTDLPGPSSGAVVGYNQRMNLLCSADKDLLVWLPDPDVGP